MQFVRKFIRISGPIPELKMPCIDQLLEKYCIFGRIRAKQGIGEQVLFVPNTVEESAWESYPHKNFAIFLRHLGFKTLFPELKLTQNCYINIDIFCKKYWQFNHKLGLPPFSSNILCLKDYLHNLTKYEIKGTLQIPISQLFSELGKI